MLYSGKVVVFWQVSCFRAKVVVFGQSGFFRAKVVVYGKKWLFSGESFCILGKSGSIREKCCIWENVVVIGQGSCNRAMCLYSGKCGCIRAKWLYPTNVVVIGQSGYFWKKGVVLGQK